MAQYTSKFVDIDPENCPLEELKKTIEHLHGLEGYYETKQLAIKQFINSIYGATASKYFIGYNIDVAESITLQGQDLNHYSENCVNRYYRGIFQSREEYDKLIHVPVVSYAEKYKVEPIAQFYKKGDNGWEVVELPVDKKRIDEGGLTSDEKKMLSKITVAITFGEYLGFPFEKLSAIKIGAGRVTEQKPLNHPSLIKDFQYLDKTTYLEGDPSESLTIAGDTDSCAHDSVIYMDDTMVTIEEAFNTCKNENMHTVLVVGEGQEVLPVKNHTTKAFNPKAPLMPVDRPMRYIMRHKVSKARYEITSSTDNHVVVTEDHSCMVMRGDELIELTAKDINIETDRLVEIINHLEIVMSEIKSVERLEDFSDEYVYDIEVDDLHNFFANKILVHNSIYVEFGRITNQLHIDDIHDATRFVVDMWNYGCGPYMENCYEEYAKAYNCDKNIQSLELEKIADTAIMLAKKHYAMSECFLEPDIYVKPGEHVLYKGIELIQRSTPPYVRKCLDEFMRYILDWYAHNTVTPNFDVIHGMLQQYKAGFMQQNPDDICKSAIIGDYEKFILDDKTHFVIGEHTPIHVQAAGVANFLLNQEKNKKYRVKYHTIKSRDRVKFYYTKNPIYKTFGFLPGQYPLEYAIPMDYNLQFEKLVLEPINNVLDILNFVKMSSDLCYSGPLF